MYSQKQVPTAQPVGTAIPMAQPVAFDASADAPPKHGQQANQQEAQQADAGAGGYRDVWAALLWIAQLIAIVYIALVYGISALSDSSENENVSASDLRSTLLVTFLTAIIALGICFGAIRHALKNAEQLIQFTLKMNIVMCCLGAIICLAIGSVGMFMLFAIFGVISWCYYRAVQSRIPFAATNLQCACQAVLKHSSVITVALSMLVVQFGWLIVWVLAASAVAAGPYKDSNGAWLGMLVSFYWGFQVFANIVHATTAGTVGSWFFQGDNVQSPVNGALKRACTTSFGSICFASLVVAILQTLKAIARQAEREARRRGDGFFLACICRCFIDILERIMRYINKYALCYVAVYGHSYIDAGRRTYDMFCNRGWTAIINDDLIDNVIGFGSFAVGTLTAIVAALIAWGVTDIDPYLMLWLGLFIGYAMGAIVGRIITSAVATIFVCWAENGDALRGTHPQEFETLALAWQNIGQIGDADYQYA